jgi:hypothetical protein
VTPEYLCWGLAVWAGYITAKLAAWSRSGAARKPQEDDGTFWLPEARWALGALMTLLVLTWVVSVPLILLVEARTWHK